MGTVMSRLHRGRAVLRQQLAAARRVAAAHPHRRRGIVRRVRVAMECREARQLAEAFVSEQLLVETTRAIVAHLERCPACRAEVEGLRRARGATRVGVRCGAVDLAPRPEFAASSTSRLQAEAVRRPVNTHAAAPVAGAGRQSACSRSVLGWAMARRGPRASRR